METGARLHISEQTVKNHLTRMMDAIGALDRASLVAIGFRRGVLS